MAPPVMGICTTPRRTLATFASSMAESEAPKSTSLLVNSLTPVPEPVAW